ncbi:MAG: hypothetical protein CVV25_01965 [Ignavibacteriae bacterium HGW-Ignavibacteriae-4]|jgi:hypothetical protein|nr:MAG: hypothetical protein CVV25_01965 [Ignavibacteriae bacterium HGW-Ignavibacteriae-4]
MKKKIIIISISIALMAIVYLAINWKSLLLNMAGFQQPKIENTETIKSWDGLKTKQDMLLVASTKANFNYLQENIGVPGIMVFNKEGYLIISNRGEGCQITARDKLKDLGKKEFSKSNSKDIGFSNINDFLDRVSNINKAELKNEIGYDYTVVYTWAKYLPEKSIEMMEAVNSGLKRNKAKVLLLSLNLDYIDKWTSGQVGDKIDLD